jgi:hypothetical protein
MARFRCRACSGEGTFEYREGRRACPICGSRDVQVALSIEEIPRSLVDAMTRLANEHDEYAGDED